MNVWTMRDEPRGTAYHQLVMAAALFSDRFSMYTTGMALTETAISTLRDLEPFRVGLRDTSIVPGSVLARGTVTLHEFKVSPESLIVLDRAADRLFEWAEPHLPNDLAFLAGNREFLVALASDAEATLEVTEEERAHLLRAVPTLRLVSAR
jgi:hypothetical protein